MQVEMQHPVAWPDAPQPLGSGDLVESRVQRGERSRVFAEP